MDGNGYALEELEAILAFEGRNLAKFGDGEMIWGLGTFADAEL